MSLEISSPAFGDQESIPEKYTCDGANTNPPLKIDEVPSEAESLVLIVDDPDAPGQVFDHWIVWNIPPDTKKIEEGQEPQGVHGTNGFGDLEYGGPCPPSGTHRYRFKLYALDSELELSEGARKNEVQKEIEGKCWEERSLWDCIRGNESFSQI